MPANRVSAAVGFTDNRDMAMAYLASLSNGLVRGEMAAAFVDGVAPTLDFLEARSPLRFQALRIPDYHPEHPGGLPQGARAIEPGFFSFQGLGAWADSVEIGQYSDPETGHIYLSTVESPRGGGDGVIGAEEMERPRHDKVNCRGCAMVGALLQACLDHGIVPTTNARATLLLQDGERVTGVLFGDQEVSARRVVIIATGGFEWDRDMVTSFLRGLIAHPSSIPSNTGDGQKMAMRAGAAMGNMREAQWVPVATIAGALQYGRQKVAMILRERSIPGTILVNRRGRRFVNEATNYNALGAAFHHFDPTAFGYANLPRWLIFDHAIVERYGFLDVPAGGAMPDWIPSASTLGELAERIGIDPAGLCATVERWNMQTETGSDPNFCRGLSAYDGFNGDLAHYPGAAATLGSIKASPYYTLRIHCSTLGSSGRACTDVHGSVLDHDRRPIPGLYAAGNLMAAATGMAYGGAGGTHGPTLVFGFPTGQHAAASSANSLR
jgi:hypothetical protein